MSLNTRRATTKVGLFVLVPVLLACLAHAVDRRRHRLAPLPAEQDPGVLSPAHHMQVTLRALFKPSVLQVLDRLVDRQDAVVVGVEELGRLQCVERMGSV